MKKKYDSPMLNVKDLILDVLTMSVDPDAKGDNDFDYGKF